MIAPHPSAGRREDPPDRGRGPGRPRHGPLRRRRRARLRRAPPRLLGALQASARASHHRCTGLFSDEIHPSQKSPCPRSLGVAPIPPQLRPHPPLPPLLRPRRRLLALKALRPARPPRGASPSPEKTRELTATPLATSFCIFPRRSFLVLSSFFPRASPRYCCSVCSCVRPRRLSALAPAVRASANISIYITFCRFY